ncbi:MAG: hypothetical protein IKY27_08610 [Bacteroidales bacterium]|nr:hypothetical protein [Bacteroidales bacterium]
MKKMLPIIILVLVLVGGGVGAYFLIRKKNEDGGGEAAPLSPASALDKSDTDSIVDHLSLSSSLKTKAKKWVKEIKNAVKNGKWNESTLKTNAQNRGVTYQQQLVISALWQMYETSGYITQSEYNKYSEEVENL